MPYIRVLLMAFIASLMSACGTDNVLTKEEMIIQANADSAVSEILFESGLDSKASYNVRKDGSVKIEFAKSVSMIDYTLVVEQLRAHQAIKSVAAEQSGSAVCILR